MIATVIGFLPAILRVGKVLLIVGALWFVYDFISDSVAKTKKITELEQVIVQKDLTIEALELQARLDAISNKIVEEARVAAELVKDQYDEIRRNLRKTEVVENDTISPIILDTIRSLDGL